MTEKQIHLPSQWQDWRIARTIGHGSYGAVYEIQRDIFCSTERAALKVISIPQSPSDIENLRQEGYDLSSITVHFRNHLESIIREYTLMADMKGHANIVYCDDLKYIQHNDGIGWDIYIKMELLTPVLEFLPLQITENHAIQLGMDICSALMCCNAKKIIHRDIKPQNIFVSLDGSYKLGDFGVAKVVEQTMSGTKVGTYNYMAPEVYKGMPYNGSADIYSLGLVLYWMLNARRLPFMPLPPEMPTPAQAEAARERRFRGEQIPPPRDGSPQLKAIVLKACAYNPADRYASAAELLRDLNAVSRLTAYPQGAIRQNSQEYTQRAAPAGQSVYVPHEAAPPAPHIQPYPVERYEEPLKPAAPPPPKKRKPWIAALCAVILAAAVLAACYFTVHVWDSGSCTAAVSCKICGKIRDSAPGHDWISATCTQAKTCQVCGKVSGGPLDHNWAEATYTDPKTCTLCGLTQGESLGYYEELRKTEILDTAKAYADNDQYLLALQTLNEAYRTDGYQVFYDAMVQYRRAFGIYHTSQIAAGKYNTVILHNNGSVTVYGDNSYGEKSAGSWSGITAVSAGDRHIIGLKADGSVVSAGNNSDDQCAVTGWKNVVAISAGDVHSVALLESGAVVATGYNENGQCNVGDLMSDAGSSSIVAIAAGYTHTLALLEDGRVVACGDRTNGACSVSGWSDIAMICAGTQFSAGLKTDGTVVVTGKGVGSWDLSGWTDIVLLAAGDYYLVGLRSDGTVLTKSIGSSNPSRGQTDVSAWSDVVFLTAGNDHTVALTANGTILCVGSNYYGQCGCANTKYD